MWRDHDESVRDARWYLRGYAWITVVPPELAVRLGGADALAATAYSPHPYSLGPPPARTTTPTTPPGHTPRVTPGTYWLREHDPPAAQHQRRRGNLHRLRRTDPYDGARLANR